MLVRNLLAFAVLLASPLVFVWLGLSPRLPKAVFLPPVLFVFWWTFGGFPVPLLADSAAEASAMGSAVQVMVAAAAFLVVRGRTGGRWLLGPGQLAGPVFRFGHALLFFGSALLLGVPLLLANTLMGAALAIEARTNGFIDFKREGVHMTERVYEQGDRSVVLVGMMHIGEGDAYRALFESFAKPSTVLLQEGVTDRDGRLGEGLDYEPLARALGLDVQLDPRDVLEQAHAGDAEGAEAWPHIRHADVDLAAFSQESIDFLDATAAVLSRDDLAAAVREFRVFVDEASPETWSRIEEDVITSRNRVLIAKLDEALGEYEHIVVPWGALHLPEVEQEVLARGFARGATRQHLLFRWGAILAALSSPSESEPPVAEQRGAAGEQPALQSVD